MADSTNEVKPEDYAKAVFEDGGALVVDLANIEALSFEVIKGTCSALIDQVDFGKSKSSGMDMFTFTFKLDDPQHPDWNGRKVWAYGSLSPKALRGTKTMLTRIDANTFAGQFKPQQVVESGVLLGKRVMLRLGEGKNEQTGEPSQNVQVLPSAQASGEAGKPSGDGFFNANG